MNRIRKEKLAVGIALLIVSSVIVAFFIAGTNENHQTGKIRVACVGDSITEGTDYPADLWMLLGANYTVGNFGVGGATVSLKSQNPYMNAIEFQNAKEFLPNIVVIMLGTNDARPDLHQYNESFAADYMKLAAEFQTLASKPKVWLVKPPPIFNNGTGLSTMYFMLDVIPSIDEVAKKMDLPTIDVYGALANHSEYFQDGVHPNSEGSKLIAAEIYKAISFNQRSS